MGVAETMGDLTGRDLERRKQIYDAMPSVVVRVAHGAPGPQGERWLRPLERLDGRFLGLSGFPNAILGPFVVLRG